MTKTQSIQAFLNANTHKDLSSLYSLGMECQVNVAQDGGERMQGEFKGRPWHGYTDGIQTWKSFRIPYKANTLPEFDDKTLVFDLKAHVEAIGMTGWDWKNKLSRWVAFDFDAITGHSDRHGRKLSPDQLKAVVDAASALPWVTIRKSTSGKGIHLYVFLNPCVSTTNHNEHAAVGRAIIGKMSGLTGFSFESQADICGQNMWVWHRKMAGTEGLTLIKQGEPLTEIPSNWMDHLKVVSGKQKRAVPAFIENSGREESFLGLTGQLRRVELEESHKILIRHLEEQKSRSWWDVDHHILISHTHYLAEAHSTLNLKGVFETQSIGTETPNDVNCFLNPLKGGGWIVRRYSKGVQESPTWDQDGGGWTKCLYNVDPDLQTIARHSGGLESKSGGFIFTEAMQASKAALALGANVPEIAPTLHMKKAILKEHKDGRLIFEIEGDPGGVAEMPGWLYEKGKWQRIFSIPSRSVIENELSRFDHFVRHLINGDGVDAGWVIRGDNTWRVEPLFHIKTVLQSMNLGDREIKNILGSSILECWKVVNKPFQPEFPGNREWNRDAARLKFAPSTNVDGLKYDSWLKILNHCGAGLDEAMKVNPWAIVNGISTGGDYLKVWVASLFQRPLDPLPYLFFFGDQNCGKTIFHEALNLLLTKGYQLTNIALTDERGFNAEIQNAIICVIEEIDLSKNRTAYNRMKDWVTARQILIHPKGMTPYQIPNTTHWIHCANHANYCPAFPGDTRVTVSYVRELDPGEMIPRNQLLQQLEAEASDFLAAILNLEIPPSGDRLGVPVIASAEKIETQQSNRTLLQEFQDEVLHRAPGYSEPISEVFKRFELFAQERDPSSAMAWTRHKFSKEFPPEFPKGRNRETAQWHYGNLSFSPPAEKRKPFCVKFTDAKVPDRFLEMT